MKAKVGHVSLLGVSILILLLASSCISPPEPMFDRPHYPPEHFYIGSGTGRSADRGTARQTAKMLAISDLASQIQTTIFSKKSASTMDDGNKQASTFEELIEETLHQEFENIIFIEEAYTSKKVQTTYAILSRAEWEGQKARKILKEKIIVESLLSPRYPDMSPIQEISILNEATSSLQATMWGSMVEGKFDGSYGFLLPMVKARRDLLFSRIIHSTLFQISEGLSSTNQKQAREQALQQFQLFLTDNLFKEYEPIRVLVSSTMSSSALRAEISRYVPIFLAQHQNLLEYFDSPEATAETYHVMLAVSKTAWEAEIQQEMDLLYQQVNSLVEYYEPESSVTDQLQVLDKIEDLIGTSFFGLAVEKLLFPHQGSIQSLKNDIVSSVRLTLTGPKSVEEGQSAILSLSVSNSQGVQTQIPVICIVRDNKGEERYANIVTLRPATPEILELAIPARESATSLQVSCHWDGYPQCRAEATLPITKIPLFTRFKNWIGIGKP